MKTFSHWRAVGRAMLDARRRGAIVKREKKPIGAVLMRFRTYRLNDSLVHVRHWRQDTSFWTFSGITGSARVDPNSAAEALRVLAALELIPNEIACAADERYGRCQECHELAQWWPGEAEAEPRWVHTEPWRWLGIHAHNPVITEHKDPS